MKIWLRAFFSFFSFFFFFWNWNFGSIYIFTYYSKHLQARKNIMHLCKSSLNIWIFFADDIRLTNLWIPPIAIGFERLRELLSKSFADYKQRCVSRLSVSLLHFSADCFNEVSKVFNDKELITILFLNLQNFQSRTISKENWEMRFLNFC